MRYRSNNHRQKKDNNFFIVKKDYRYRIRTAIIACSYAFNAINCFFAIIINADTIEKEPLFCLIMLGIVMGAMVPISVTDVKKENHGRVATIAGLLLHLSISLFISFMSSYILMIIYACEVLLYYPIIKVMNKK